MTGAEIEQQLALRQMESAATSLPFVQLDCERSEDEDETWTILPIASSPSCKMDAFPLLESTFEPLQPIGDMSGRLRSSG
mmetsp:Transcript_82891/g.222339  ORF Transcript_82891/g.222339 Transcript_82891/m.222339 type:complete len:80 (+) Transcript_82891:395-634(+)